MGATRTRYEIPDIDLARTRGGTINPASFIGHELVVVFCPADTGAATRDLADYVHRLGDLCDDDAWILAISDDCDDHRSECEKAAASITIALDPGRAAWEAFQNLLGPDRKSSRDAGAVFLFDHGGALRRSWAGSGHASDVVRAVRQRR